MSNSLTNSAPPTPGSPSADVPRILLLEDSPGEAELFCQALALVWERFEPEAKPLRPGVDVQYTAQDALEGVKRQVALEGRNLPDLIVLDLDLPGGASPKFLRELRNDFRLASLPVVVMAWSDEQPSMRTLYGLGVVGYLIKPLHFSDLLTMVSNICQTWLPKNRRQEIGPSEKESNIII